MSIQSYEGPTQSDTAATGAGTVSVTTSDTAIVSANSNRISAIICNDHASQYVYLALGTTALANRGICLAPKVCWECNTYTGAIRGISVGGTSVVTVVEIGG